MLLTGKSDHTAKLMCELNSMKTGDFLVLPGGWATPVPAQTSPPAAAVDWQGGHVVMYVVERHGEHYSFIVINTGLDDDRQRPFGEDHGLWYV